MRFKVALGILSAVLIIVVLLCGVVSTYWPGYSVEISEVRSDWGDILYAADGSGHGFIEIYNNSSSSICMDGWYLSDSTLNWDKYQISGLTLAPHSYAVFWSNEAADVAGLPVSGYFLGFSLSPHEPVILTNPDGRAVDKITVPALEKGYSYAKGSTGLWGVRTSTPGTQSMTGAKRNHVRVASPTLSHSSGFYEGSITVEIQAPANCKVYYTLDGSKPCEDSFQYTQPLELKDPTSQANRYSTFKNISTFSLIAEIYTPEYAIPKIHVLRAVAVDANGNTSDEAHASYFIDYEARYGFQDVLTLSIISDPENFFSDELGIYVLGDVWNNNPDMSSTTWIYSALSNYNSSGKGWRRPAELELFNEDRELIASQLCGVSIHGGWSVIRYQKSFNLYAFSDTEDDAVIFPGVFDSESSSVMLRAGGFRDVNDTKIRDVLNQSLVADRALTIQDGLPCQVFLNGEYWGLYNLQERISKGLIASTYNVNENNLVILKNGVPVVGEAEDAALFSELLNYVEANDLSLDANYAKVCEMIDIQSYIDYNCFQIYVANCDSVANNHALWRTRNKVDDQYGDGRWRWILYDTDDSAGMVEGLTEPQVDSFTQGHWTRAPLDDLLFSALLKNENFKLQFAKTFVEMAEKNFSYDVVEKEIDRMCRIYMPATIISHHRFEFADCTEEVYLRCIQTIKDFYANRYPYIYDHMIRNLGLQNYEFSN